MKKRMKKILSIWVIAAVFSCSIPWAQIKILAKDYATNGDAPDFVMSWFSGGTEDGRDILLSGADDGYIPIDEEHFPSESFRKTIRVSFDTSGDGKLSPEEIANAKVLKTYGNIYDMKGIEYLTALEILSCSNGSLERLDISRNTALKELDCSWNLLRSLDVSKNTALEKLDCSENMLESLDVSKNTALEELFCFHNFELTELDVSKNTTLKNLQCGGTSLNALDVSKNTALTMLRCYNIALKSLDVSRNTALTELICNGNELTELDVSKNTALESLNCSSNFLQSLDLSRNTALKTLKCGANRLTSLDLSKNTLLTESEFSASNNRYLFTASGSRTFDLSALPGFDVSKASNWEGGKVSGSTLTVDAEEEFVSYSYDCGNNIKEGFLLVLQNGTASGVPIDAAHFPDPLFRWAIRISFDEFPDGILTAEEAGSRTSMYTGIKGIGDLTGIEYFTALETLQCNGCRLRKLDVSKNTKIKSLRCEGNLIRELKLGDNRSITSLNCGKNLLESLDVGKYTSLVTLECYGNRLKNLDVSKNTSLVELVCYANELKTLDVSKNTKLSTLSCGENGLSRLDVSKNTALEELYCSDNPLGSLDISKNTALKFLDCKNTQLETLDVGKNTKLSMLWCGGNMLYCLDLSSNKSLNDFECEDNKYPISLNADRKFDLAKLSGFNVKKASGWTGGTVTGNTLTVDKNVNEVSYNYDCGSGKTAKFTLTTGSDEEKDGNVTVNAMNFPDKNFRDIVSGYDTSKDGKLSPEEIAVVTAINVAGKKIANLSGVEFFTGLKELDCSNNSLTTLDISKNTALITLDCSKNQLSSLDVSKNTALITLKCEDNHYAINVDTDRKYDLSTLPGSFDVRQAGSWTGGKVGGNILTVDADVSEVSYSYDCGNNYKANFKLSVTVVIKGLRVAFEDPEEVYVYTGGPIKPAVIVTENGSVLTEGTDYILKYTNNVNASTEAAENRKPRVTVIGKGNLAGNISTAFEIQPKSLNDMDIVAGSVVVAENSKAAPILAYGALRLSSKDYVLDDASKTYAADGVMTVTGKGNYYGTRKIDVKVVPKDQLRKFTVTVEKETLVYNGKSLKPSGIAVTDSKTKEPLDKNSYEIAYARDTVSAGNVKFTVVGKGLYSGSVTKSYQIKPLAVSTGEIKLKGLKESYTYKASGAVFGDEISVTYGSEVLKRGRDYKIVYSNNKKVSTDKSQAKYAVAFLGNYKGSAQLKGTFRVQPAVLDGEAKVTLGDKIYTGKPGAYISVPYVTVGDTTLKKSDYTVSYYRDAGMNKEIKGKENLIELGMGTVGETVYVKIVGKGNYAPTGPGVYATGSYGVYSTDMYKDLSKAKITVLDKSGNKISKLEYTGEALEPEVKVELKSGKESVTVDPQCYTVSYANNVKKGKAVVIVTGTREYAGSATGSFSIVAGNMKNAAWNVRKVAELFLKAI